MLEQLSQALRATVLFTLLTGLIYPAVITGLCQVLFKDKANGSLVTQSGQVVGSALLSQNFTRPEYFHPRPSAAGNDGYDPTSSAGSNLGPTSQKLYDRIKAAADEFRKDNPDYSGPIPSDALTTSGSGLDPEISLANATAQAARVAKSRGTSLASVQNVLTAAVKNRDWGFLGEPRVNVLELNLALDRQAPKTR